MIKETLSKKLTSDWQRVALGLALCLAFASFSSLAEKASKTPGDSTSRLKIEEQKPAPALKRFKASVDHFFYEFEGVRASDLDNPSGDPYYGFDRVTFDTTVYSLSYNINPLLALTVQNSFNVIYAETWFGNFLSRDRTEGFSDTTLKATKTFVQPVGIFVVEGGAVLPTGSITQKNRTFKRLSGLNFNYPYNMQMGSGTYDFMTSGTFIKPMGRHQVGALGLITARTGRNTEGYRRGDEFMAKTWYSYAVNQYFSPGIWANYQNIQGIVGKDRQFVGPAFDNALRFYYNPRSFWDITPNMTAKYPVSETLKLKGMLGSPLFQHSKNIDDVQLYTQWFFQIGIEGTF